MKEREMKRFNIEITPSLTPAEWFFHARNIGDEAYQLGYEMDDYRDSNESRRLEILKARAVKNFEGIVTHPEKEVDEAEIRQLIDKYKKDQDPAFIVRKLTFTPADPAESMVNPRPGKGDKFEHYDIEIEPALTSAEWFFHVRSLQEYVWNSGYYLDDLKDGFILDRRLILDSREIHGFEGFIGYDDTLDRSTAERFIKEYLEKHGLRLVAFTD